MIPWTESAAQLWEDYCRRTRENLRDSSADAEEVLDDLRRHVEEEIAAAKLSAVTEEDMQRILARVGEPVATDGAPPPQKKGARHWMFLIISLLFGVLLPTGTILFEFFTGISASALFDPIPTWFQILAVAIVPATNFWLWLTVFSSRCRCPKLLNWLAGVATGVATFYCILYLPFAPIGALAIIYLGIGLIPLAPYLALLFTLLLWARARRLSKAERSGRFWAAFGLAFVALLLAQLPAFLTYRGLARAASDDLATSRSGVNLLRHFGQEELLLRSCYGLDRESRFDIVLWVGSGDTRVPPEKAREIYFRTTGRPFNSVPAPSLYTRSGRLSAFDDDFDFSWDDALGGEAVAGRVKGLSLQSSRMDAVAEPDAAVAYCEWTMEFKNVSPQQREARAQIALPPDAVVSRLTLWVNGEEREAAFGGRSQTREAYKQVAVQQRRDPVLVTTCGPDRVLIQCFPVPANGGTMKVRIGITAPLVLESAARGRFQWPEFLERNFKITPEFKHAVWMESPLKISPVNSSLIAAGDAGKSSLHGELAEGSLGGVLVERVAETRAVWTPAIAEGQVIRQRIEEFTDPVASRIVLVIDGSAGMHRWAASVAEATKQIPLGTELAVVMANDSFSSPAAPVRTDKQSISNIADRLAHFHFSGGCDNIPALEKAWDLAAAADHGAVIWIHDTQPILLSSPDSLRQRIERGGTSVSIFDFQLSPGPNRLAEQLDGLRSFKSVPRRGNTPSETLNREFELLEGKTHPLGFVRDCVTAKTAEGPQVSRHIERLWARNEAARLAFARHTEDASKLAAGHQLVTPVSGAVVLETKQQYESNNLKPADPQTVPVIPEPSTGAIVAVGTVVILLRHFKRRSTNANKS